MVKMTENEAIEYLERIEKYRTLGTMAALRWTMEMKGFNRDMRIYFYLSGCKKNVDWSDNSEHDQ